MRKLIFISNSMDDRKIVELLCDSLTLTCIPRDAVPLFSLVTAKKGDG